jgi:hypothetical protein
MSPALAVISAAFVGLIAMFVTLPCQSVSVSGFLTLVFPAFALVYVLFTFHRVNGATG